MSNDEFSSILEPIIKNPDRKQALIDLAHEYMNRDQAFREMVTRDWDFGVPWIFPDVCRLASTKNEVDSPENRIRVFLVSFSITENDSYDIRDDLVGLAVVYHSCLAANIDPEKMFRSVADISTPKARKLLLNIIERSDNERSMKAFSIVRTDNEDGEIVIRVSYW